MYATIRSAFAAHLGRVSRRAMSSHIARLRFCIAHYITALFPQQTRRQIERLACRTPASVEWDLTHWSLWSLAQAAAEQDLVERISPVRVGQILHDMLRARVLLLESGNKVAFVSIELTWLSEAAIAALQKTLCEMTDISSENVLVFVTHTFSAPHFLPPFVRDPGGQTEK
jgi:hypothetical protein